MLEKINNISAGSEYGKSAKVNSFIGGLAASYTKKVDAHDSVNISPALLYLNQINWKLKEFKHVVNEKVFIDFIVSEIEFQTTIDLAGSSGLYKIDYKLIKEKRGPSWRSKTLIDLSSRIGRLHYDADAFIINFSAVNIFLQRLFDMNVYREISGDEKYLINDLTADLLPGILSEFDYLNNFLFIFIDKLTGIKLIESDNQRKSLTEPLSIKRIKVINAE